MNSIVSSMEFQGNQRSNERAMNQNRAKHSVNLLFSSTRDRSVLTLGLALLLLVGSVSFVEAELFRWSDEKGNTYYTDRVPPEYLERGYKILSEQGTTVQTIAPIGELDAGKLAELSKEQKEQQVYDRNLRITYSNETEFSEARDRKLADINTLIKLSEESVVLLEQQFHLLTKEAGDYERQGKSVPEAVLANIALTHKKLINYNTALQNQRSRLKQTAQQFEVDLLRYREITGSSPSASNQSANPAVSK